ncbi:DoxX family protein [Sinomonas sp. G460-2]|uniref:DoxX family protein n=1 Tax=Sinomonas sp. G460-2 TaxID=3393464 RepID=UPI0039EF772A
MTASPSPAAAALPADRVTRAALAIARVLAGLLWIQNLSWKSPTGPNFGGLHEWTENAVDHPVFAPWAWTVEHIVLPNFAAFAWMTLIVETCLGAFLLVGLATRFWAVVGLAQTAAITLSAVNTPGEWFWSYALMFALHLAILGAAAGRTFGLDGVLRPTWRSQHGPVAKLLLVVS